MSKIIFIKTRRYSTLINRIFEEYKDNVEIYVEGHRYTERDMPELANWWCNNRIIKRTIDFTLKRDGVELFGFHDTPDQFWAAMSEQPFVERLAKEKIVRYRVYSEESRRRKTSKLAVASAVISLVLCIGCVCNILTIQDEVIGAKTFENYLIGFVGIAAFYLWPVAFLLGLSSLVKIKKSRGLLKGYIFGCAGLLLSMLCFHYVMVLLGTTRREAKIHLCQENMKWFAEALRSYSNDYDGKYPTADKWCDLMVEYKDWPDGIFFCSSAIKKRVGGYAINPKATPNSASDVVLVFETNCNLERCWNRFGGAELLTFENHRRVTLVTLLTSLPFRRLSFVGCCNVLLNDGSVKLICPEQVGDLNWGDEGEE